MPQFDRRVLAAFDLPHLCWKMAATVLFKVSNGLFLVMFLLGAVVQYNDPDPSRWIAVYLLAAGACLAALRERLDWRYSAVVAAVCLVWSSGLVPVVISTPPPISEVFTDVGMYGPGVEEARELGGLWIIASWLILLSVRARRQKR